MHPYSTAAGRQRFGSTHGENLFYTGNSQTLPIMCNTQTIKPWSAKCGITACDLHLLRAGRIKKKKN